MIKKQEGEVVGLKELADMLGITVQTVWAYRRNPDMEFPKPVKRLGYRNKVLFDKEEVTQWIKNHENKRLNY